MKTNYLTIALILLISVPFFYFFDDIKDITTNAIKDITGDVVYNPVDCEAKFPTCDAGEINVLDISSFTNAHISANNPTYLQVCCPDGNGINTINVIDSRIVMELFH